MTAPWLHPPPIVSRLPNAPAYEPRHELDRQIVSIAFMLRKSGKTRQGYATRLPDYVFELNTSYRQSRHARRCSREHRGRPPKATSDVARSRVERAPGSSL